MPVDGDGWAFIYCASVRLCVCMRAWVFLCECVCLCAYVSLCVSVCVLYLCESECEYEDPLLAGQRQRSRRQRDRRCVGAAASWCSYVDLRFREPPPPP